MKIKILLFLAWFTTLLALASIAVEIKQIATKKINELSPELMVVPQENVVHKNLACKHRITRHARFNSKKAAVWNT